MLTGKKIYNPYRCRGHANYIRLILPYVVLHYANKTLVNMKGYYGEVV